MVYTPCYVDPILARIVNLLASRNNGGNEHGKNTLDSFYS